MTKPLSMKERSAGINRNLMVEDNTPDTPPVTVPGMSGMLYAQSRERQQELDRLKSERGVNLVPLNRLHEVEGRKRHLSAEEYAELRDNLRHNQLITPATVSKRPDGDWDIISGNNRVEIYRELGREEIAVYEIEVAEGEGDAKAFYANLLHPSLPDFEKYLGFKKRMKETGMDARKMAAESGISEKRISDFMAFDRLPNEALAILSEGKSALQIGVTAALEFAKLAESGRGAQVLIALSALNTTPEMTQHQAVKLATSGQTKNAPKPIATTNVFKLGKMKYAEVRGIDGSIRISLSDADDRAGLQEKIEKLINDHITELKAVK